MRRYYLLLPVFCCALISGCGASEDKTRVEYVETPVTCAADFADRCADIQSQIDAANLELAAANESDSIAQRYIAQMQLNELVEIRDAYRRGEGDINAITSRYDSLKVIIEDNAPLQVETGSKLSYGSEELAATREVLKDFGELTLSADEIADTPTAPSSKPSPVYKVDDKALPWAAYWYPKRGQEIFEGDNSPMKKLDDYFKKMNVTVRSQEWERSHYDSKAAEWEGLCDAWAIASSLTIEPRESARLNGIDFTTSDLKAIAIKYFEGYAPKIYGRRYQGSASTDGQIQDLRPEAFHKIVEQVIGVQKKPLIIDEDPGPEIWSKPLFRMSFKYSRDPKYKNAIIVKAYPWMIRQRSTVKNDLTSVATDLAAPLYEYRLFHDPIPDAQGRLKVLAGEWIGASVNFHPDMVYLPGSPVNKNQGNEEVRKNHEEIRKLLIKVGMIVESI
jgi:hypothetical protein